MTDRTVPLRNGAPLPEGAGGRDEATGVRPERTVPLRPGGRALDGIDPLADRESASTSTSTSPDPDDAERLVGRILAGRYEVRRVLGRGGMGIVYEGRHVTVGRPVAIKVLRRDLARSTQAVARFHREAQAAASIGSEHIVEVFDFGYSDEGDAFIVMELLDGEDLGRLVRREGALPEGRAVGIARQIARALEAAHAKGIIHRDLKSENVFVTQREGQDFIKLVDFGISKVTEGDEGRGPMTTEGVIMGTPHYMAPEQAMGDQEPDHRIDIYALGCILYEMLTGRVPFGGRNPVEVVFKHVHELPVPPSRARHDGRITPEVEAVVMRALEKKREARYASAAELLAALPAHHWLSGADQVYPTPSATRLLQKDVAIKAEPPPPRMRRMAHTRHAWIVGGALVGGGAMLALAIVRREAHTQSSPHRGVVTVDAAAATRGQNEPTHTSVNLGHDRAEAVDVPALDAALAAGMDAGAAASPDVASALVVNTESNRAAAGVPNVTIVVRARPLDAMISVDGVHVGRGTARLQYPRGSRHHIAVVLDGRVPHEEDLLFDRPGTLTFALAPAPHATMQTEASMLQRTDAATLSAAQHDAGASARQPIGTAINAVLDPPPSYRSDASLIGPR